MNRLETSILEGIWHRFVNYGKLGFHERTLNRKFGRGNQRNKLKNNDSTKSFDDLSTTPQRKDKPTLMSSTSSRKRRKKRGRKRGRKKKPPPAETNKELSSSNLPGEPGGHINKKNPCALTAPVSSSSASPSLGTSLQQRLNSVAFYSMFGGGAGGGNVHKERGAPARGVIIIGT